MFELFQCIEAGRHPAADKLEPSVPPGFAQWFDTACAPDRTRRFPDVQTAWKKLMAALECGRIDLDPSIRLTGAAVGDPGAAARGRVAAADPNASTLEASPRGVEARHRRTAAGSYASETLPALGAVPSASTPPPAALALPAKETPAPSSEIDAGITLRRQRRLVAPSALLIGLPLIALAAWAGWRAFAVPTPPISPVKVSEPAAGGARESAPSTAPSGASAITGAPSALPASAPPASASARPRPTRRAPLSAPRASPAPPTSTSAAAASTSREAPPPAAASVADPSSYR